MRVYKPYVQHPILLGKHLVHDYAGIFISLALPPELEVLFRRSPRPMQVEYRQMMMERDRIEVKVSSRPEWAKSGAILSQERQTSTAEITFNRKLSTK